MAFAGGEAQRLVVLAPRPVLEQDGPGAAPVIQAGLFGDWERVPQFVAHAADAGDAEVNREKGPRGWWARNQMGKVK